MIEPGVATCNVAVFAQIWIGSNFVPKPARLDDFYILCIRFDF